MYCLGPDGHLVMRLYKIVVMEENDVIHNFTTPPMPMRVRKQEVEQPKKRYTMVTGWGGELHESKHGGYMCS